MKKLHQTGSRRRLFRRLILTTTILPAALAVQAFAVDWNGAPVTLTINPTISAGLQEGRIDGDPFDLLSPNPVNGPDSGLGVGVSLGIRMGQSTLNFGDGSTADPDNFWSDNRTWIYTGEINSGPTGRLSFAESIDDSTQIKIDGIVVLQDGTLNPTATGVLNFAPNTFHAIEVRMGNGFGSAGPVAVNNFTPTYGFGFSQAGATGTDGANYAPPVDPGTGSLFHFITAEAADANQDINVLSSTTVTLSKVTNDHITENSIAFAPSVAALTLTLNSDVAGQGRTLRSLGTTLATTNTHTITITGAADFAPGALSTGPTPGAATLTGINLVKTGTGSLILDNPTNALLGTTIRVADGTLSILGSGGTANPVSTLTTAIEIGGAGAVAPVLRIGSSGTTGTTFNNLFKTTQNATLEHLTGTTDTISGATFSITSGRTLTVNVAAGGLAINGTIADPSNPAIRGGTLKKMGNNTTLTLSGAMKIAGLNAAEGRLEVLGKLDLSSNPIIGANATLSLQNTSAVTPNIITFNPAPTTITVPTGTLEGLPGAFGAATNVLSLTGGTLNLGVNVGTLPGLTAHLYDTGSAGAQAAFGGPLNPTRTFTDYFNYFAGRGAGTATSTGAGGVTELSFDPGFGNTAMFAVLAPNYTRTDEIVSRFNGKIIITTPGLYTFATDSDDGSMLFIDSATVVSNNASQAHVRRTGKIQLSAGLHDIDIGYYEGGGLNGLIVDYSGPDTADAQTVIPNSVLVPSTELQLTFQNPITISQNAVINATAVSVPSVKLTAAAKTLTVNGQRLDMGVLNLTGGAGTYTINANTLYGQVNAKSIADGGNAVSLVNHGLGALIIENGASPQLQNAASTVTVDVGPLGLVRGTGEGNPTGNATVTVNSGKMILSSKGGDQTFPFPNTFGGVDRSISATQLGSGVAGAAGAPIRTTLTGNMTLPAGSTLSLSSSKNYILAVGGVTGGGSVNVQGGAVESAAPINLTGTAQITVTGTKFTTQGLAAGAITVTDSTLTNTGTLSSGTDLTVTRSTVTANGGTTADSVSIADSFYSSTGALATGAGGIVLTGGMFKSSTLELHGGTISGGVIAAQNGVIRVAEGTTVATTSATFTGNVSPTGLLGRFINRGGTGALYPGQTQAGVLAIQTLPAAAQTFLTDSLSFLPYQGADATFSTFFGSGADTATFAMGFFGNFTPPTSGSYRFQIARVDDTAGFWIDLDGDNVFETAGSSGNELASQVAACCGDGAVGAVTLVGGRSYHVAMALEDTGGGSSFEARFALPGEPSLSVVNPNDPVQAGLWTYALPNQVNVDAGAELDIQALNGNVDVLVNGRLELDGAGSSTINSLTIGTGAIVELGPGTPPAPADGLVESAAVPEPGSSGLILLGALGCLARRQRAQRG